jgi:hypothetical protein
MKMILSVVTVAALVAATVALARPTPSVSETQVQAAIDARLHQLLVDLNQRHHP